MLIRRESQDLVSRLAKAVCEESQSSDAVVATEIIYEAGAYGPVHGQQ